VNKQEVRPRDTFHPHHLVRLQPIAGIDLCIYPVSLVGDIAQERRKLSPRDQVRLRQIQHPQKQKEFVASRLALRELDPNYRLTYEGRIPWMANGMYVSLTHAHNVGAAMLSRDYIVGLDVELQREQLFKISQKFLHPDEKLHIRPERALQDLHVYWGAKEALFKIWKVGEVDFSHELRVDPFPAADAGETTAQILKNDNVIHCLVNYQMVEGYHLVFAWTIA
jgi:4'-phosphopantetheinyl transferase EntD